MADKVKHWPNTANWVTRNKLGVYTFWELEPNFNDIGEYFYGYGWRIDASSQLDIVEEDQSLHWSNSKQGRTIISTETRLEAVARALAGVVFDQQTGESGTREECVEAWWEGFKVDAAAAIEVIETIKIDPDTPWQESKQRRPE